ncbi:MAG: N-acetyltransferase [bacterium ADurb.Bin270]|nr:MAG: N-acetyltransferase [bacterium ADurb.Bin270]
MHYADVVRDFLKLTGARGVRPDLEGLKFLARLFHRMPYENLTKIARFAEVSDPELRPRMPDIVLAEHMEYGAGGTCFSLTYFFDQILTGLGYETIRVFCDRSYGPDTHCALIVSLGSDRYLVDPGYLMEAPVRVPKTGYASQSGRSGKIFLERLGETSQLLLVTESAEKRRVRYKLKDVAVEESLFLKKWIDSFEWAMMRHISISVQTGDGIIFLRDGVLRKNTADEKKQDRLSTGIAQRIEKEFGISPRLFADAFDAVVKMKSEYNKENKR